MAYKRIAFAMGSIARTTTTSQFTSSSLKLVRRGRKCDKGHASPKASEIQILENGQTLAGYADNPGVVCAALLLQRRAGLVDKLGVQL